MTCDEMTHDEMTRDEMTGDEITRSLKIHFMIEGAVYKGRHVTRWVRGRQCV
jgi:hypothetical protein